MPDVSSKARYIMIGGFLGAGKTTAILQIAQRLRDRGLRVGLITNDQSEGLVDTTMLGGHGFAVEEITGGCFCCKFNSLAAAADKLSARTRPDVFIAEPVGSCTDLKATVDYPLRRIYGDQFAIAPFSVMLDPIRASRILGLTDGKSFSNKVIYIYRKQLEEAEIIVINKTDLLSPERLAELTGTIKTEFPAAQVRAVSARHGSGIDDWIAAIEQGEGRTTGAMDVDYDLYADGEARLGWLNCTCRVGSSSAFDGNDLLIGVATRVQSLLRAEGGEIAHLKLTLTPREGNDLAVANVVGSDAVAELSHRLHEPLDSGQLIVNLRAEADPELLRTSVMEVFDDVRKSIRIEVEHLEAFRPGKPTPTHRLAEV